MSSSKRSKTNSEVSDMLPYQKNCALMALARTERVSSQSMLSSLKLEQGLKSGKDLEHDKTLSEMVSKRGYKPVTEGFQTWDQAQSTLREIHKGGKGGQATRYFAITYPPNTDPGSGSAVGHAISMSVGKGGGVSVFGSNSDRDHKGKWLGGKAPHESGGRPFQMSMSGEHQVQLFSAPIKKK